ncbi:hypothetical protein OS493_001942 [Desmophyllum pertusum]|uniref:Uncharacterized protein n=1 Tax=Desmophyllum pertusum TaxID=174260 RepID=A0A9W9Z6A2_9CNID|nr:hypothetical protein OS493_001942 [Desmophyllum pertusum]
MAPYGYKDKDWVRIRQPEELDIQDRSRGEEEFPPWCDVSALRTRQVPTDERREEVSKPLECSPLRVPKPPPPVTTQAPTKPPHTTQAPTKPPGTTPTPQTAPVTTQAPPIPPTTAPGGGGTGGCAATGVWTVMLVWMPGVWQIAPEGIARQHIASVRRHNKPTKFQTGDTAAYA